MKPGDRIRGLSSGTLGFVLYESNTVPGEFMIRLDGRDYNTVIVEDLYEVLPAEPFRPHPLRPPIVAVTYHLAYWPYKEPGEPRSVKLARSPAHWSPPMGAYVTDITVR